MRARFIIGQLLVLAGAMLVSACSTGQISRSGNIAPSDKQGLVIVGYSYISEPPKFPLTGQRCPVEPALGYHDNLVIDITRLEPTPSRAMEYISAADGRCAMMTPDDPVGYNFILLEPGLYRMTGLVPNGRISFTKDYIKYRLIFDGSRPFRVNAGDVLYLGDVIARRDVYLNTPNIPAGLPNRVEVKRSDEAVKAEISRRKGPVDKVRFVPVVER